MDVTSSLTLVILGMAAFTGAIMFLDLFLDFRWIRQAQRMHAKGPSK